ncbi:MAG: PBP1A family penicillin-binding protein [Desulfarculales bacterium]|jgi:penicillin-binding protein 1A|nr:PBP1A family penicillin-binding protein [Desulfarculales bacterium]
MDIEITPPAYIAVSPPPERKNAAPAAGPGKRPRGKKKRSRLGRFLLGFLFFMLIMGVLGIIAGAVIWFFINEDLPRIERLSDYQPPAVTQLVAKDGSLMAEYYDQRRYVIQIQDLPPHVIQAFVAAEDGNFFQHPGFDLWGIIRAAINNLMAGRVIQGGSTITQQVAKTLLLTPERTFIRKLQELILAWKMEQHLSKEEILYLYLNQIFLGNHIYGVEAAAQTYFGKPAKDVNLAEAALLAGLVQAPSRYSPIQYPRRARTRQVYTIGRMLAEGFITKQQAAEAMNAQLMVRIHRPRMVEADYYSEAVRQWLDERFGKSAVLEGGLTVYTACDPAQTQMARKAIGQGLLQMSRRKGYPGPLRVLSPEELAQALAAPLGPARLKPGRITEALIVEAPSPQELILRLDDEQGALSLADLRLWNSGLNDVRRMFSPGQVVLVETVAYNQEKGRWDLSLRRPPVAQSALVALEAGSGRVRAMVGGRDYQESQFNRAIQAIRQPGSSFKPYIYCAALDRPEFPYTAGTMLNDTPAEFPDLSQPGGVWRPRNFDGKFLGAITVRRALELSRNVPTVKMLADLGLDYTLTYLKRFGFKGEMPAGLSLGLGAGDITVLEHTRAFSVFANQGRLVDTVMVEKVLDRHGNIIYESRPVISQVISPAMAFVMTHLLRGVIVQGTGAAMNIPEYILAGKTGTTNDTRDAWFVGFSPQIICGVWVGRDDNKSMGYYEQGGRAAGPIWKLFMQAALADMEPSIFPIPEGISLVKGEGVAGFEAYLRGTEPGGDIPTAATLMEEVGGTGGAEGFFEDELFN